MEKDFFKKNIFCFTDLETSFNIEKINKIKNESEHILLNSFQDVESNVYLTGYTFGTTYTECENNYKYTENIKNFYKFILDFLLENDNVKQDNMYCYIHNLNYDINFMLNDLIVIFKTFKFDIIGDKNKLVQFKIINEENKKSFIFVDSLNILRMKLSQFDTGVYQVSKKSELLKQDMSIMRDISHVASEDEKEYLYYDVLTLCAGVFTYFQDKDFHLTTSSFSYQTFLKELRERDLNKYFFLTKKGFLSENGLKNLNLYNFNSLLNIDYTYRNLIYNLEKYYKGGQTFINKNFQSQVIENVFVLDVNSLYPFCYLNCKIPIIRNKYSKLEKKVRKFNDEVFECDNTEDIYKYISEIENIDVDTIKKDYFTMFTFSCSITLKKDIDFSPVSIGFCDEILQMREFISDSVRGIKSANVVFKGSEYDLKNWLLYYNISNITLLEYFIFDTLKGKAQNDFRNIMSSWIEKKEYYSTKENYNKNKRNSYKLLMNSLTGKFGEKIRDFTSYVDCEEIEIKEKFNEEFKTRYIMMILSLISFSRLYMSKNILKMKDNFVYCDTDSIALVNTNRKQIAKNYNLDEMKVGLMDIEKKFSKAIYQKPKTYVGIMDNKIKFTVAGAKVDENLVSKYSKNNGENFAKLLSNNQIIGKKIIKVFAKNGIILLEKPFIFKNDEKKANQTILNRSKKDVYDYVDKIKYLNSTQYQEFLKKPLDLDFENDVENLKISDNQKQNFNYDSIND